MRGQSGPTPGLCVCEACWESLLASQPSNLKWLGRGPKHPQLPLRSPVTSLSLKWSKLSWNRLVFACPPSLGWINPRCFLGRVLLFLISPQATLSEHVGHSPRFCDSAVLSLLHILHDVNTSSLLLSSPENKQDKHLNLVPV